MTGKKEAETKQVISQGNHVQNQKIKVAPLLLSLTPNEEKNNTGESMLIGHKTYRIKQEISPGIPSTRSPGIFYNIAGGDGLSTLADFSGRFIFVISSLIIDVAWKRVKKGYPLSSDWRNQLLHESGSNHPNLMDRGD